MTASPLTRPASARPGVHAWSTRRGRWTRHDLVALTLTTALATGAGYAAVVRPQYRLPLLLAPLVVWLLVHRLATVIMLGLTLPYVIDVSHGLVGLNMAISDLLMTALALGLIVTWAHTRRAPELAALRPLSLPLVQYVAVMAIIAVAHPGVMELVKLGQRLELFLVPLLIGAFVAQRGWSLHLLRAYLVGATVTGALWITGVEIGQKNPTGQFIANGLILLLGSREVRRRMLWTAPVLAAGVLWTQSRGAILSVGIGFAVILLVQRGFGRARSALVAVPVAVLALVAFRLLPEEAQARNLSFRSGTGSRAEWALKIREGYRTDAWAIIHSNPITGVGIGQYRAGSGYRGTYTSDPHQVLLLQAAEGGYALAVSFVVLIVGAIVLTWTARRGGWLTALAAGLTAAVAGHGLVDVYWVRGTPVLGWLVIGMVLAEGGRRERRMEGVP